MIAKGQLKQREDSAYLFAQVSLLCTDVQDTVTGLLGQLFQEGIAVVKAVAFQVRVLWERGTMEEIIITKTATSSLILLCPPWSVLPIPSTEEPETQRENTAYMKLRQLGTHMTYLCLCPSWDQNQPLELCFEGIRMRCDDTDDRVWSSGYPPPLGTSHECSGQNEHKSWGRQWHNATWWVPRES